MVRSTDTVKWNLLAEVDVRRTQIVAKDAMILLDDKTGSPEYPRVYVDPGLYVAEIHVPEPRHCSRFRIRVENSKPTVSTQIGTLDVDNGKVAFVDYDPFLASVRDDSAEYEEWTETALDDELAINFSGQIEFSGTFLVYVTSGDGDGTYPVFELLEDGKTVGLECRFEN